MDLEHFREVLPEIMRCSSLDTSATYRDVDLNGGCVVGSSEPLILRLSTSDHRHSQELFISRCVDFKNLMNELICFLLTSMSSMTFLPKELSCPNERSGMLELPSDDIGPLIQEHRQVSMRVDPLSKGWVHDSLTGGTNCNGL